MSEGLSPEVEAALKEDARGQPSQPEGQDMPTQTTGHPRDARRALHDLLSATGHHRLPFQDALIAATSAHHNVGVLHYDGHFDTLSTVLGFENRWVATPGSL